MKDTRVTRSCQQCGATMLVKQCLLQRKKYCSRRCLGLARVPELLAMTATRPTTPNSGQFQPGQNTGKQNAKWLPPVPLVCEECGGPFALKPWILRQREKHNGHVRFCSRACLHAHRRKEIGPLSHNWIGGGDLLHDKFWKARRHAVIAEQHGRCARCRVVLGTRLHVHHIEPRVTGQDPHDAHRADNLLAVCNACHGHIRIDATSADVQRGWRESLLASL